MQVYTTLKTLLDARIPAGICVRAGRVPEYLFTQTITQLSLLSTRDAGPQKFLHTRKGREMM
jgi:hypothetical protein